jgi:hypothetical protein
MDSQILTVKAKNFKFSDIFNLCKRRIQKNIHFLVNNIKLCLNFQD